jgi:hypothetical protein
MQEIACEKSSLEREQHSIISLIPQHSQSHCSESPASNQIIY